jgi:hypothetical protein
VGHQELEVVVCLENITPLDRMPMQFDLTAGSLTGPTPGAKHVARITPVRPGTMDASQWSASYSQDGKYFAYSTGGTKQSEVETLYAIKTEDLGIKDKAMTVGKSIARWQIAVDSQKLYYLGGYNYSESGDPSGTLTMVDFPSGQNATVLMAKVGAYQRLYDGTDTDRGLGVFDNVRDSRGNYSIMGNRNEPAKLVQIAEGVGGARVSPDLKYVFYNQKSLGERGNRKWDAHVIRTDGTGLCTLRGSPITQLYGAPFPEKSYLIFWTENINPIDQVGDSWVANPADCSGKRKWSTGIDYWFFAGDDGLVYTDEGTQDVATLRSRRLNTALVGDKALDTPASVVYPQTQRIYASVSDFQGVLYNITRRTAFDGLYLYSQFGFAHTVPKDAGAPADQSQSADIVLTVDSAGGGSLDAGVKQD